MNAPVDVSFFPRAAKPLASYRPYWAKRFGTAPFLPMSREEMARLGWDSCDVILVTGDAYIDHPSFGMALVGRLLEAQGFRVGIISQPDWLSAETFRALGAPALFFGITAGNMDSMINRYTADRKLRSDDAYTPDAEPNRRPDRAVVVYAQRAREAVDHPAHSKRQDQADGCGQHEGQKRQKGGAAIGLHEGPERAQRPDTFRGAAIFKDGVWSAGHDASGFGLPRGLGGQDRSGGGGLDGDPLGEPLLRRRGHGPAGGRATRTGFGR